MRTLIALILSLAATLAGAASPTFGTHGMVLFGGTDALYASHLPMYHAPHDYQVVLRVRLADPAIDAAVRARLQEQVALWTLDPEKFALERLAPGAADPLKRFRASVVLGHFERDGVVQHQQADILVEQVLHFRQLPMQMRRTSAASYLQLGRDERRFLVKLVEARPDFDHIFAVDARPGQGRMLGTVYYGTDDLR